MDQKMPSFTFPCRRSLGIDMVGEPAMQHLINIHFFSDRMGQMAAGRPGMLYFVFNAQVVTVMVAHDIKKGEFVAQVRSRGCYPSTYHSRTCTASFTLWHP